MEAKPAGRPGPMSTLLLALVLICCVPCLAARAGSQQREQVWLALSDVHLDIFDRTDQPSTFSSDTNVALLDSALGRMKRAVPDPAVVLLPGDFLVHHFAQHVDPSSGSQFDAGVRTMRFVASALERAFPKALFAIALGNNDVPCGDYRSANGSEYLASVARIWAPLVDRDGAAPDFVASFSRGGHYTARLPVRGLRLVVLNTVVLSSQYEGSCDGSDFNNVTNELRWLVRTLRATPPGARNVVMMHIPPGYDAFSTEYIRGLLAWPFLERRSNAVLVRALADPSDRVAYAIAGHAHRFDFRLAAQVPVVVLGSLSPIYRNSPAFYALHVARDGTLTDVDAYGFDEGTQTWSSAHSFDRRWGVDGINAASLARLHARLANLPAARAVWDRQANGWPTDQMESPGTWAGDWWRVAWCAQDLTLPNFAQCAGIERGTRIVIFGAVVAAVAILLAIIVVRLRVVKRPGRAGRAFE